MGDYYGLSVQASKSKCSGVIMCGVRFMAETCKILSPDKKVWLPNPAAGCPMAEQLDLEGLRTLKADIRTIRLWRISIQHQNSRQNVMYV